MTRTAFVLLVAAALCSACVVGGRSGQSYSQRDVLQSQSVLYGEVVDIREVLIEGIQTGGGAAGGAAVGYAIGRTVFPGDGRYIAGAVGGVLGGIAGDEVERQATKDPGLEISVELDGGRLIAIVQLADETFGIGERVRVLTDHWGGARVRKL